MNMSNVTATLQEHGITHNFTRLIGRFKHMTGKDKETLKNVVERLKVANTK